MSMIRLGFACKVSVIDIRLIYGHCVVRVWTTKLNEFSSKLIGKPGAGKLKKDAKGALSQNLINDPTSSSRSPGLCVGRGRNRHSMGGSERCWRFAQDNARTSR